MLHMQCQQARMQAYCLHSMLHDSGNCGATCRQHATASVCWHCWHKVPAKDCLFLSHDIAGRVLVTSL